MSLLDYLEPVFYISCVVSLLLLSVGVFGAFVMEVVESWKKK